MKMSCLNCKLCGLLRSRSSGRKERSSIREERYRRYVNEKERARKSRREIYEDSCTSSSSSISSLSRSSSTQSLVRSTHQDSPKYHSRHRSESPVPSRSIENTWPPRGYSSLQNLSPSKAAKLISAGAPIFCGHKLPYMLAEREYYHLFATILVNSVQCSDGREDKILEASSFRLHGSGAPKFPWETIEQPSMVFYYGSRPGTVRLNYWANLSSRICKNTKKLYIDAKPYDLTLTNIIKRLVDFDSRVTADDLDLKSGNLYKGHSLLSDLIVGPQKTIDFQIHDLTKVLSCSSWINFSKKENHVVGKFFVGATFADGGRQKLFFHQTLLALELELRIQSYNSEARTEYFRHLPEKVKWDLVLAKIWRQNIKIESVGTNSHYDRIRFRLCKKEEQLDKLHTFAKTLKWPTLSSLKPVFSGAQNEVEAPSSSLISYLTAVILPGPTLSYLLMNSLIEIDPSSSSNIAELDYRFPNTGFQYRGSTYWKSNCIVGKVLAPTCNEVGGWIGPALPAFGLSRNQIARIRQRRVKRRLEDEDVESMNERSLPLGPVAEKYPIKDYILPKPNNSSDSITDNIRIEKLNLWSVSSSIEKIRKQPKTFDASIQFAFNGNSWPLTLKYDVTFVHACLCKNSPHPLFYDYDHKVVRVNDILQINDWVEQGSVPVNFNLQSYTGSAVEKIVLENVSSNLTFPKSVSGISRITGYYDEKVLVIEAYGVVDNEVLARAWCAHWGLSAIIADIHITCMACAIRESYASCINVLILIDSSFKFNNDDDN